MFRVFRGQKTYARADDVGDDDQKNEREREKNEEWNEEETFTE